MAQHTASSAIGDTLAIHGGDKVRPRPMPPRLAFVGEGEQAAVNEVFTYYRGIGLDPGYQGEFEKRYCRAFVEWMGGGHADAVSTGSAAVFIALAALELPPGSHVIVSPVTDPGTIGAIVLNQHVPVLMDSMPGSFNSGPEQFESRITPQTRAVVLVHAAGVAADAAAITDIAHRRGIKVVEDCSQAHGALLDGRKVGLFGDIAAFSTMYRKAHATGGSGGVVFALDEQLYWRARAHADRGKPYWREDFDDRNPQTFVGPALNFNLDEISCAIGLKSLGKLASTIERRLAFLRPLDARLRRESAVCTPTPVTGNESPFYYPIGIDRARLRCSKYDFAMAVRGEGIDLSPDYKYVVCEWPWMAAYAADGFVCANAIERRESSFNIYLNENYGLQEAEDVATAILKVERHYAS
jgi:dTDP-4-amino-4,6-dideoxygalactose transaminase